jgi:hypothetical protein
MAGAAGKIAIRRYSCMGDNDGCGSNVAAVLTLPQPEWLDY